MLLDSFPKDKQLCLIGAPFLLFSLISSKPVIFPSHMKEHCVNEKQFIITVTHRSANEIQLYYKQPEDVEPYTGCLRSFETILD